MRSSRTLKNNKRMSINSGLKTNHHMKLKILFYLGSSSSRRWPNKILVLCRNLWVVILIEKSTKIGVSVHNSLSPLWLHYLIAFSSRSKSLYLRKNLDFSTVIYNLCWVHSNAESLKSHMGKRLPQNFDKINW